MKKILLLTFFGLSSGILAAGGNLGLDTRLGYVQRDNDFDKTGDSKESNFLVERFRIRSAGKINDQLSYYFRINLLKANDTTNESGVSKYVDVLTINHQITKDLKISFGKFITYIGGREWDYNGADQYQYSYFGDNSPANSVGGQASYDFMGQNFTFQMTNGDESTANRQTAYWMGWTGNLLDGKILPIVAYGLQKHGTDPAIGKNQTTTYITAGARFVIKSFEIEADYLSSSSENATTVNKDDDIAAMVFLLKMRGENFRPFVKYSNDTVKISGEKAGTVDRITAALEYYPDPKENFRYHVAYTTDKASSKSGDTAGDFDYSKSAIFFGVRANIDMIK